MVIPLLAPGFLKGPRPAAASLFSTLPDLSGFGSLWIGPSESGDRDPDFRGDDALLAQIAVRDPSVRAAVLRQIDRRLSDDLREDAETTARLERVRDLLRPLDEAPPAAAAAESEPDSNPPSPRTFGLPQVRAGRVLSAVAKVVPEALRGISAAVRPAAPEASAELLDRVLRASKLVQARGISRLRLTLEPPELGEIRLDLTLRGSVVRATFQAEAPGAAESLLSRLSELKSALEKRGLQVGELSVLAAGSERGIPCLPPAPSTSVPGNLDLKA